MSALVTVNVTGGGAAGARCPRIGGGFGPELLHRLVGLWPERQVELVPEAA
jgi:hypothetical protein